MLEYLRELNIVTLVLRLVLAALLGGILGIERGQRHRPAGCRTYCIVCIGAALAMILSQYESYLLTGVWASAANALNIKTDVSRFGAQVINGIGFLGAGTIIVTGKLQIKGLTTAAGLWASACMGLAIGAGFYSCAAVGFIYILLTFLLFNRLDNFIISRARNMDFYLEFERSDNLTDIIAKIKSMNIQVFSVDVNKENNSGFITRSAVFSVKLPAKTIHSEVLTSLSKANGVNTIKEI